MQRARSVILWAPILAAIFLWQALPWGEYPYNSDCLRLFLSARNLATLGEFPLHAGDTIFSLAFHGPILSYLFAPVFLFSTSLYTGYMILFALNSILCLLVFRFGRDFFGREVGILAALFCCVTHIVTDFRWRLPSNHPFVPFFTILFFTSLFNVRFRERSRSIIPALFFLGALLQIHVIAFPAALLFVLFLPWRRIRPAHLTLGLIAFFLSFGPYYIYLWRDHAEIAGRIGGLLSLQSEAGGTGLGFSAVAELYRMLFSVENSKYLGCLRVAAPVEALQEVSGILFLAGFILPFLFTAKRGGPEEGARKAMILIAWFVLGALLLLCSPFYYETHLYFIWPAVWILTALGLQGCAWLVFGRQGSRWAMRTASLLVFVLVALTVVRAALPATGTGRRCRSLDMPSLAEFLAAFEEITRFGLDEEGIQRHVLMDQAEADSNLYMGLCRWFLERCSAEFSGERRKGAGPDVPYFILLDSQDMPLSRPDAAAIIALGNYRLIRYDPLIDQTAWRHSEDEKGCWFCPDLDDSHWEEVDRFPFPLTAGEAWSRTFLRGYLRLKEKRRVFLVLNPNIGLLQVEEAYVNGAPVRVPDDPAEGSEDVRVSLDVTDRLVPGENLIAFSFTKADVSEAAANFSYWTIYDLSSVSDLPLPGGFDE